MALEPNDRLLKLALVLFGVVFCLVYPIGLIWPSGWVWHEGHGQYYLQMICGIYATLGIFLIAAARDPQRHQKPDLFHDLVERRACRHHGSSGDLRWPRNRSLRRRRPCPAAGRGCAVVSDAVCTACALRGIDRSITRGTIENTYVTALPQTCSSSVKVPRKSLGCRNSTGLPCAPILGLPSPSTRAPCALSRSRAAMMSSTS